MMLAFLLKSWIPLLAMGCLILLSAFFSGSEAALFSLGGRDKKLLSRGGVGGQIATRLLADPERLLSAILFWNLLINMIYFSIAAILGSKLERTPQLGGSAAIGFTLASLFAIIFLSEMLPKSFAVLVPRRLSAMVALPLDFSVRLVGPVLPIVTWANSAVARILWPTFEPEPEIELGDIERAIQLGTDDAALLQRERMALSGLVQIADTRVAEWMRPRSRLWLTNWPIRTEEVFEQGIQASYLMVLDDAKEMIVKAVGLRALRPSHIDDINAAAQPVIYVPWSARVSQVLDQLNNEEANVAVVVNEFGELVGALTIDDICRQVLAPSQPDDLVGEATIQSLDAGGYRVWGAVSVRRLAKKLEVDVDVEGVTTVAGFIGRHTERLTRVGDEAPMDHYLLRVIEQNEQGVWVEVHASAPEQGSDTAEE